VSRLCDGPCGQRLDSTVSECRTGSAVARVCSLNGSRNLCVTDSAARRYTSVE
jgi:hypothetical protein